MADRARIVVAELVPKAVQAFRMAGQAGARRASVLARYAVPDREQDVSLVVSKGASSARDPRAARQEGVRYEPEVDLALRSMDASMAQGQPASFTPEDLVAARKAVSSLMGGVGSAASGALSVARRAVSSVGGMFEGGKRFYSTASGSDSPFPVDGKGRELFNADAYIAVRKASLPPGAILERPATVVGVGPGGVIHQALIDGCREYEQMMRNMGQDPWTGFEEARVLAGRVVLVFAPDFTKYPTDPKVVGGLESKLVDVKHGRFTTGMETRRGDRPVVYVAADMFLVTSDKDTSPMDFEHNRQLLEQMGDHSFEPQLKFNPFPADVKVSSSPLIAMLRHPGLDETDRNNVMKFDVAARWANCSIYNALKHLGTNGLQNGLKMVQSETTLLRQVFREQNVSVITWPPFVEGHRIIFETDLHVDGAPLDKPAAVVRSEFVYSDDSGDPEIRARELSAFLEDKARNNMVHMSAEFR
ncbi:MAG: hypothetical protein O3A01_05405 [bacterium]|nr:hypothetical protein [bacterium]